MSLPEIRPYQQEGIDFLAARPYALLAWEMRLGKSMATIRAALEIGAKRLLVLCPAVVRPNWAHEFKLWGWPHRVVALTSARQEEALTGPVAVVASYDVATSEPMRARLAEQKWDVLVADECHYLKTRVAKRTYAVYGPQGLARSARRMWSLSGTPAPNHAAELWPLMRCYGVTDKNYEAFVQAYCNVRWDGRILGTRPARVKELRDLLAPIMLRKTRAEVSPDLPPILYVSQTVEATPTLPKDFPALPPGEDVLTWLETHAEHGATLRRALGVAKAPAAAEQMYAELASDPGRKLVVGAHHRDVIATLEHALSKFGVVTVTGESTPAEKERAVRLFQTDDSIRVFDGNLQAAGVGIDLSAADNVAIVEPSWRPADNVQFAARAQGFDKTRGVTATFFSTPNSLDDYITAALVRKSADFTALFDGA